MRLTIFFILILFSYNYSTQAQDKSEIYSQNWPEWRGPEANGFASDANPPIEWSETKNVKWKIEIPGKGHATPIIWGDKIFIQTAVETNQKAESTSPASEESIGGRGPAATKTTNVYNFNVMAINRISGGLIWNKTVCSETPVDGTHELGTWASNSPVTDGEHLFAYFGSRGLYCLDFKGNILWQRDFGQMVTKMNFGEGSSPTLYKDKIVLVWDHEGDSFLYVLDKATGKDILKIPRDEATAWATPMVVTVNGKEQIITSATSMMRSYYLTTGEIIWYGTGMTANVIPSPIVNNGILYLMSGFRGNALKAIDLSKAKGNIDGSDAIIWEYNQNTPYTPSALLAHDKLYFLRSNNGNLTCLDIADGKVNYSVEKLDGTGTIFASLVGAKDRIYITSQTGLTYVVKQGPAFEILAKNQLEDGNFASPAIVGNNLYIRGFKYLYCLSVQ